MNLDNITFSQSVRQMACPRQGWIRDLNRFAARCTAWRTCSCLRVTRENRRNRHNEQKRVDENRFHGPSI